VGLRVIHNFYKIFLREKHYNLFISSITDERQFGTLSKKLDDTAGQLRFALELLLLRFTGKNGTTVNGSSMSTSEEPIGGEIPWGRERRVNDAYYHFKLVVVAHLSK
jgi:hypothetical protein